MMGSERNAAITVGVCADRSWITDKFDTSIKLNNLRAMENVPEKIYLQIGEDADVTIDNSVNYWNDLFTGAITWCADKINENDIEYVRSDLSSHENSGLHKHVVNGNALLNDLLNSQQEIISSPIRFNGVSNEDIKRIFAKHGIDYKQPF